MRVSLGDSAVLSSRKSPRSESSPIGRLQRQRLPRRLEDEPHLPRGHARALGQLLGRGLAAHLVDHEPVHPRDPVERLHHVHGDADGPGVVRDGAGDGLPDPPRGVGRELEPAPVLEAVHRLHEADVALLDEVEEGQLAAQIALGHRDDQAEIGLHQLLLGLPHHAVVLLDLARSAARRGFRARPASASSVAQLAARRASAPHPLGEPADLDHELVDQRGLERQLLDDAADRGAVLARSTSGSWPASTPPGA